MRLTPILEWGTLVGHVTMGLRGEAWLTTATCGSTIFMTISACSNAYDSCGFMSRMLRASFGLFWIHVCLRGRGLVVGGGRGA